jgi:hypothetical protein
MIRKLRDGRDRIDDAIYDTRRLFRDRSERPESRQPDIDQARSILDQQWTAIEALGIQADVESRRGLHAGATGHDRTDRAD